MKKSLSITIASALAFGAVIPAFANEVNTLSLQANEEVDVRLKDGKEIYSKDNKQVFKRYEIFNYNGATSEETEKHTLKSEFKDLEVLVEQKDENDANNDLFVLCKKSENSVGVATSKAKYDALVSEINTFIEDGYTITRQTTNATISYEDGYKTGEETVILTKDNDQKVIVFKNVDILEVKAQDEAEILRDEIFKSVIDETKALLGEDSYNLESQTINVDFSSDKVNEVYKLTNLIKYTIENNLDKFDVVVDESGNNNSGKLVKLYKKSETKDNQDLVISINFSNVSKVDDSKIVDMPLLSETDFANHWAKDEIIDAMLNGHVDSSNSFRPKESITRAEFTKMVCTLFDIKTDDLTGKDEPFHDVDESAWYYKYVTALYNEGGKGVIIDGYEDSTFKPNESITRQEASKIIASAYSVKGGVLPLQEVNENGEAKLVSTTSQTVGSADKSETVNGQVIQLDSTTSFADDSEIKAWADASVENLKELGIVKGYEGNTFKPENTITRVEALLMLSRGNDSLNK